MTVEPNPYAPSRLAPDAGQLPVRSATRGQRIAGAALVVNAAFIFADAVILVLVHHRAVTSLPLVRTVACVIDLVLGAGLLAGKRKLVWPACARAGLGAVLGAVVYFLRSDAESAFTGFLFCGVLLALAAGDAGKYRLGAGLLLGGLYAACWAMALGARVTGTSPAAATWSFLAGNTEYSPIHVLKGVACNYQLTLPNDAWRLGISVSANGDRARPDRRLARPDRDAHITILVGNRGGEAVDPDIFADDVFEDAKRLATDVSRMGLEPLTVHGGQGRLLHIWATVEGAEREYLYGVFSVGTRAILIIAWAPRRGFPELEPELRGIIGSFVPPH